MNWLSKLFGHSADPADKSNQAANPDTQPPASTQAHASWRQTMPGIRFGRYSDNNKTRGQTQSWYLAEDASKEKRYTDAFQHFFHYLADPAEPNVQLNRHGDEFEFSLIQGSKKVQGAINGKGIKASTPLVRMEQPSTAVMRRLLEMNYTLYYSYSALDEQQQLCMVFQSDIPSANPSKLYFGLRELAIKADRQDDLLLADFPGLAAVGNDHVRPLPETERKVKYQYFRKWITEALDEVAALNADSFAGTIAYILLTTLYRIDFLILPEAALLVQMEQINAVYWEKKDELPLIERNKLMANALGKMLDMTEEAFSKYLFDATATFSIATPLQADKYKDNILVSNKDSQWYMENKYPKLAVLVSEYGMLYNEFGYSIPKVQTDLTAIYLAVLHADYFTALGMTPPFYDVARENLDESAIKGAIDEVLNLYRDKYRSMQWNHNSISYKSLYSFSISFSEQVANLNLETRRD